MCRFHYKMYKRFVYKKQIPIHKSSAQKLMFTAIPISLIRDNKIHSIVTNEAIKI